MRVITVVWAVSMVMMGVGCAPSDPSDHNAPITDPLSPMQKAVRDCFLPTDGAMFGSVAPSASCEAAIALCGKEKECKPGLTTCLGVENTFFHTRLHIVARNARFERLSVDVVPDGGVDRAELHSALMEHFNEHLHTAETAQGFAHWTTGEEEGERYDVTLIEHRDDRQNTYFSVSYYPGGL